MITLNITDLLNHSIHSPNNLLLSSAVRQVYLTDIKTGFVSYNKMLSVDTTNKKSLFNMPKNISLNVS